MEVIKFNDMNSLDWNQYMDQLEGSSFAYLAENILFQIEYAKNVIANESFVLMENKKIVGIACIYIYQNEKKERNISWGGRYCPAPIVNQQLDYKSQEKYVKSIMKKVDEIAQEYQCKNCYLKFEPIANAENQCKILNYNYLMKYDYKDQTVLTQILDIRESLDTLYGEVRKGHKSDIKKGEEYEIEFYDKENITEEKVRLYREIYESDAGMVTRNSEMWYHYYKFVKHGYGVIGFAKKEEKYVAVIIVTYYKNMAYYSSYAELTDELNGRPVGHVLQWKTIQYLKEQGIEFYEIGEQVFGNYERGTEEAKLVNISNFKRGFGGYTVPNFMGVKSFL